MTNREIIDRAVDRGDEVAVSCGGRMIAVSPQTITAMEENSRRMGEMILQLGTMIGTMQRRLDEMEARQAQVTVGHADVKQIQARIRTRADELCRKYGLDDPESVKQIRAAIRKDALRRYQVKDLHDVPETMLPALAAMVDSWTNIRLVMERREKVRA